VTRVGSTQEVPVGMAVWARKEIVTQMVENFLDNALKATHQGGVHIRCRAEGKEILIEVEDSGCGIPREHLASIFDKGGYQGPGREALENIKKKTELGQKAKEYIDEGKLVNFLSNDYYSKKYASKDSRFNAGNGFRFGGGGRHYDTQPGVSATNLTVKEGSFSDEELIREVKDGLYIGRIWYTYPVNGSTSADFSSTIRGDSYIIKGGQITNGLTPNTLRINDNVKVLLSEILGVSKKTSASLVWGAEEVVVCPEIAFEKMRLTRIAEGLY